MVNYFIFVFNEKYYEPDIDLVNLFKFPKSGRVGIKLLGRTKGSWGLIISKINKGDKVIWFISGKSKRKDRKRFWGHGEITKVDNNNSKWDLNSTEFEKKELLDTIINQMPPQYQILYQIQHPKGGNYKSIGFFGPNQIDKFQYDFIIARC